MNRYAPNNENVTVRYDGKRVFKTTRYPIIPVSQADIYITSTDADYLDSLAKRFYKDSSLWWVIAQANNIKGTMKPESGIQLRIPGNITTILSKFSKANS